MTSKAKLIKKDAAPSKREPKPAAKKIARRGGPAADPRAVFASLFEKEKK